MNLFDFYIYMFRYWAKTIMSQYMFWNDFTPLPPCDEGEERSYSRIYWGEMDRREFESGIVQRHQG